MYKLDLCHRVCRLGNNDNAWTGDIMVALVIIADLNGILQMFVFGTHNVQKLLLVVQDRCAAQNSLSFSSHVRATSVWLFSYA